MVNRVDIEDDESINVESELSVAQKRAQEGVGFLENMCRWRLALLKNGALHFYLFKPLVSAVTLHILKSRRAVSAPGSRLHGTKPSSICIHGSVCLCFFGVSAIELQARVDGLSPLSSVIVFVREFLFS